MIVYIFIYNTYIHIYIQNKKIISWRKKNFALWNGKKFSSHFLLQNSQTGPIDCKIKSDIEISMNTFGCCKKHAMKWFSVSNYCVKKINFRLTKFSNSNFLNFEQHWSKYLIIDSSLFDLQGRRKFQGWPVVFLFV